jgi:EmrB/QacA subfamily drug resistance transporter
MSTLTAAPPAQPAAGHPRRWAILAVVLCAEVMDLLDGTIVNVAAPSIRADLGGSTSALQWLGAAYILAFAVLLITGGRLGDLFGRRRMFLVGAAGFTAASAGCAAAPTIEVLIATRVLQGAFGALMIPQGFGVIKEVFAEHETGKAFAAFGPVMGLSAVAAPIVGGGLIEIDAFGADWRTIFLVNLPVGLAALAGGWKLMPADRPARDTRLDTGGVALLSVASLALIYGLVQGRELGWPLWIFGLMAAGLIAFAAFAAYERRRGDAPLIEPGLLRNRAYTSGMLVAVAFFAAMIGLMLVMSLFCQLGLGFSPLKTGLAMAPLPLGIAFTAPASFALVPRFGRKVIQAGMVGNALGLALLAGAVAHFGEATTAWALVPGGLVLAPLFDLILTGVGRREVGSASGVLNAVQQFASAVGIAVIATVFFAFLDHGHTPAGAMGATALITIIPLVAGFVLAFRLPERPRPEVSAA